MNDFPTTLRVIASYKAGEDLAERLTTAVAVQQSMSEALLKAADEIERLRLTEAEREAISEVVDCLTESGTALTSPTATRNTLAALLERLK
jgi:hypothetical protein